MKKVISLLLCLLTAAGLFSGCSKDAPSESSGGLKVVATVFPAYDWVRQIAGEKADELELTMLLDKGVDLHSYQPTADDMIKIATCDLFIYVGGSSDQWIADALSEATNKDMVVIDLMDVLGASAKEEELVEGMQGEDEEADGAEYDEHVWLSVKNARLFCAEIADRLSQLDPENAGVYSDSLKAYDEKLAALDAEFAAASAAVENPTLLFGDRFPFRYLTDDYGIKYYAAFVGCSAETEASFETITFLSGKMDELGLPAVLTIEGSDGRIAELIISNTKDKDQQILTMDSMQATTAEDAANGAGYLSIMEGNLEVLKEALK